MNVNDMVELDSTVPETPIRIDAICALYNYLFSPTYSFHGERHEAWEIVVCFNGVVKIVSDDKEVILHKRQMYMHRPFEYHNIASHNSSINVGIISFLSHSQDLYKIADKCVDCTPFLSLYLTLMKEGVLAFAGINGMCGHDNQPRFYAGQQLTRALLETFLIQVHRNTVDELPDKPLRSIVDKKRTDSDLINTILAYLKEHVDIPVRLDEIALHFGYAKDYIGRVFKKKIGKSIIDYHNLLRIEKAQQLMSLNKYSISDIWKRLNFSSAQYFSTVFKKVTGTTPTVFCQSVSCSFTINII